MNVALYIQAIEDLDQMDTELQDGFEVRFVADYIGRIRQGRHISFSDKQRAVIVRMVGKYLGQDREDELTGQLRIEGT